MRKIYSIASVAECCIDQYVDQQISFLGGTAWNTSWHVSSLGEQSLLFSCVGNDSYGERYKNEAASVSIETKGLQQKSGKTSTLEVRFDQNQSPLFSEWNLGVLHEWNITDEEKNILTEFDCVRTVLFKPLVNIFDTVASISMKQGIKVADFAGVSAYSEGITIIERYIHDFDIVIKSVDAEETQEISYIKKLSKTSQKKFLLLMGREGSMFVENEKIIVMPTKTQDHPVDTNGAGDAYIAAFLVSYLHDQNIRKAMEQGTHYASKKIMNYGGTSVRVTEKI